MKGKQLTIKNTTYHHTTQLTNIPKHDKNLTYTHNSRVFLTTIGSNSSSIPMKWITNAILNTRIKFTPHNLNITILHKKRPIHPKLIELHNKFKFTTTSIRFNTTPKTHPLPHTTKHNNHTTTPATHTTHTTDTSTKTVTTHSAVNTTQTYTTANNLNQQKQLTNGNNRFYTQKTYQWESRPTTQSHTTTAEKLTESNTNFTEK